MSAANERARQGVYAQFALGSMVATLGMAIAALPAALRVSAHGVSLLAAWLALWGSAALMTAPAAGALRIARPLPRPALGVLAGLLVAAPALIVFARIIKTSTHHRPLGAATFAVVAAAVVLGAVAVMARWVVFSREPGRFQNVARIGLWAVLALAALGTMVLSLPASGSLLDAVLALAVAAAAAFLKLPASLERIARIAGPVALLIAVGAGFALRSEAVRGASATHAPVLAGPL